MNSQGIYIIENIINNRKYIGQVCQKKGFDRRFIEHKSMLINNKHYNKHLQNAWNKYGEINFEFKIAEIVDDRNTLSNKEKVWIDNNIKNIYNIQLDPRSYIGKTQNETTRKKIGDANRKRIWKKESRIKLGNSQKNKIISEETKQRMSEAQKGKLHKEETKIKIGIKHKNKIVSKETKQKISKSKVGKKQTLDSRGKRFKTLLMKPPKFGFKGVRQRTKNCWQARTRDRNDKEIYLGSYKTEKEAAIAYDLYVIKKYGENNCYLNNSCFP